MKWFTLLGLFIIGTAQAGTRVESFEVSGLFDYSGKYLSIFFVSGRPASIGTVGQEVNVNKVMSGPHTFRIPGNGTVSVPEVSVPREGWSSYNYAIFVVHEQARHALSNLTWSGGSVAREQVRYHTAADEVPFTEANQAYLTKATRTSRQMSGGQEVRF